MAGSRRFLPLLSVLLISFNCLAPALSAQSDFDAHLHRHLFHAPGHRHLTHVPRALSEPFHSTLPLTSRAAPGDTASSQGDYTCGPGKPCANEACCGPDGWCGYEPKYCGKGCQSNCDAKAECGKYAKKPGQECPLNVCCSQYGFCGTTKDFCAKGCQSNCNQPKPSAPKSNSRQRVIGYWEGWNSDHPCGTMTLGEIPVDMLTHLNIAFGYIDHDFKITNMDGVSPDLYRNVGNLKAKNPDLKVIIALGGWTFSDPGTKWQNIFPSLTSSRANRAIFIKNLLGFLSQYGYDGVDFDWEYPGAKDRGGSGQDAVNYVSLVKELRSAIESSGQDYIITFTAPTSYWYLRHFDPKGMEPYVDWINLMSYDLHGTWDSDNPIGSQVLAHSNLTEIDLALDLFWRVGVKPQNIVLGLGFYGRSFKLKSSSCWKPGCRFSGPGDKGPCTDTAGILSYREIQNILSKTGATSYHDKTAAVRYFVYNDNSWISYDDKETFKSKIEYANEMGLSGLMIWAIDQDDNDLSALSAVTDGVARNQSVDNFDLVDLKHIFPKDVMPADISDPHYGIITFGSGSESGELDPTNSGFGFLLAVGESHGLSQLRKREGKPEPFVFLDCPDNVFSHPINKTQKARVVCTSQDVEGCFRIKERGVEGTLVEMPDDCAPNSFARAISLEVARDQTIPESFASRSAPTSQVFEFSFDFDKLETRGDAKIAVRMDATNVKGYWDALVDSPGVETRSLESRYFSALNEDWKGVFRQEDKFDWDSGTSLKIKKDLSAPVFWQAAEHCPVGDEDYGEGIAAFASGNVDAEMFYSVSVVATSTRGSRTVNVKEANGFIKVTGKTDLVLGIGGMGRLDIDQAGQGNPVHKETPREYLGGHKVHAGAWWGSMNVSPYISHEYILATENGRNSVGERPDNAASFNGRLTARVESDFGNYAAIFPNTIDSEDIKRATEKRKKSIVTSARDDILYSGGGEDGSTITLGHYLTFGVSVDFVLPALIQGQPEHWTHPVDMMVQAQTLAQWVIAKDESSKACTDFSALNFFYQFAEGEDNFGWDDQGETMFYSETIDSNEPFCWAVDKSKRSLLDVPSSVNSTNLTAPTHLIKRGSKNPKDNWGVQFLNPNDALRMGADQFVQQHVDQSMGNIDCDNGRCTSCLDVEESRDCCGCVCMVCVWGARGDIEDCAECSSGADGIWPGNSVLKRSHSMATIGEGDGSDEVFDEDELNDLRSRVASIRLSHKEITVCDKKDLKSGLGYRYPAFPADVNKPWDGADGGKWDSISRYWGNASADCSDWTILKKATADVVHVGNGVTQRADYESEQFLLCCILFKDTERLTSCFSIAEHVYEAQFLSQFFTTWLVEGKVKRQRPAPGTTVGKVDCKWVSDWIIEADNSYPWEDPAGKEDIFSLLQLLHSELGNMVHQDRLTIALGRLNNKKQNLFGHKNTYQEKGYKRMSSDEQLQLVKEHGLLFNYMNHDDVWEMWCDTYNAMRVHLVEFDKWYPKSKGDPDVTLADEWDKYHRVALDSIVLRSRETWKWLYDNRR
ncbi:hypothetical protein HZS61_004671 [Fusarium oxysporum f. sp. conglutinans]|uniref:chitinase n=1 Tax=Fusarium oxysporum f. sp. conglutinans TaxID=100902 RepID=A0A8H6LED8_FUSOX|nr:hypothetical protein HZS61_004671 [Fusarium oxysporum f. sp. conglutinans]KAG6978020.1 Chitotriosidase-1 [Fusarium oxysporum f. sp. conglutinans]